MNRSILAKKIFNGSVTSLTIKIGGAALAYFVQLFIANKLGAEQYGVYTVVITLVNFVATLSMLGLNTASLKLVSRYRLKNNVILLRRFLDISLTANLIFSGFITILIVAIALLLEQTFGLDYFLIGVLIIMIPLESLLRLLSSFLLGASYVSASQLSNILLRPILVILCLLLLEHFSVIIEIHSLMAMIVFVVMLLVIIYLIYMKKLLYMPSFSKDLIKYRISKIWLIQSLPFVAISICNVLLNQLDILMISSILGNADAGKYAVAVKVSGLAAFMLTAVNLVIAPLISSLYTQRNFLQLAKMLSMTAKVTTLGALIVLRVLVLYREDILLMFGQEFIAAGEVLIILLVSQVINISCGSVGFLLNMSGRQVYSVKALIASSIVNVIANAILIPKYGIEGAAYATVASTIVWNLYMVVSAYRELGINTTVFSTGRLTGN